MLCVHFPPLTITLTLQPCMRCWLQLHQQPVCAIAAVMPHRVPIRQRVCVHHCLCFNHWRRCVLLCCQGRLQFSLPLVCLIFCCSLIVCARAAAKCVPTVSACPARLHQPATPRALCRKCAKRPPLEPRSAAVARTLEAAIRPLCKSLCEACIHSQNTAHTAARKARIPPTLPVFTRRRNAPAPHRKCAPMTQTTTPTARTVSLCCSLWLSSNGLQ